MDWDLPKGKLVLGDLTDLDPDQMGSRSGNIDNNYFDKVVIVGQETGAMWTSFKAVTREAAFNDESIIQDEFNEIKILDIGDESPFGFV